MLAGTKRINYNTWTSDQDAWLTENYPLQTVKWCALQLKLNESQVRNRTIYLKLGVKNKKWNEQEINFLIKNYENLGVQECTKYLNRNENSIANKAKLLKLKLKKETYTRLQANNTNKFWEKWKKPENKEWMELYRQKQSDRMVQAHRNGGFPLRGANRNIKTGKRTDLNNVFFRSGWEANYARYLNFLIKHKQIYKWEYEPDRFIFEQVTRGTRSYCPDFKVWESSDSMPYYIEIKGWMSPKSQTQLKRMAKYYPDIKIILIKEKEYKAIKRDVQSLIPGWE